MIVKRSKSKQAAQNTIANPTRKNRHLFRVAEAELKETYEIRKQQLRGKQSAKYAAGKAAIKVKLICHLCQFLHLLGHQTIVTHSFLKNFLC